MRFRILLLLILLLGVGACVMHKPLPQCEIEPKVEVEHKGLATQLCQALIANPWIEGFVLDAGRKPILMIGNLGIAEIEPSQNLNKQLTRNLLQSGNFIIVAAKTENLYDRLDEIICAHQSDADFLLTLQEDGEAETDILTRIYLIDLASGESQPLSGFAVSSLNYKTK